ncbi:MAG: AMP-dependent synthetase/ligase [Chloroflexia bacterium]
MESLGLFVQSIAEQFGPRPAILYKPGKTTEVWSYIELKERANRVARWLGEQGVRKGDRIILWAPSSPLWVAAFLGAIRAGVIVVPLDTRSGPDFAERVIAQTAPKLAILAKATKDSYKANAPVFMVEGLADLPESGGDVLDKSVTREDIATLMFTSGTTGDPKGVIMTHGNILANMEAVDLVVPNIREFKVVSLLPLSHSFEQTIGLLLALKRGTSVYYVTSLLPATIFDALKEHGATAMLLVPGALQLFMSSIEREITKQGKTEQWKRLQQIARYLPQPLRRLLFKPVHDRLGGKIEFFVSGGAPIAPELVEKWERLGIPLLQGYGATEAGPVISATNLQNRNPVTVGKPIPGMQVKIAPDGEVMLKGPSVTPGYWRNPSATEAAFEDGWYKTGDLGYFDKRGHLVLHGRKKDLIVLANGQNVYPEDVERALKAVPGVTDAVVIGLPDNQGQGVEVHAVLIPDKGVTDTGSIVKQANARLAPHQYVKTLTVWPDEDFPRTHTLKVKKHEVLARVLKMREEQHTQANLQPASR